MLCHNHHKRWFVGTIKKRGLELVPLNSKYAVTKGQVAPEAGSAVALPTPAVLQVQSKLTRVPPPRHPTEKGTSILLHCWVISDCLRLGKIIAALRQVWLVGAWAGSLWTWFWSWLCKSLCFPRPPFPPWWNVGFGVDHLHHLASTGIPASSGGEAEPQGSCAPLESINVFWLQVNHDSVFTHSSSSSLFTLFFFSFSLSLLLFCYLSPCLSLPDFPTLPGSEWEENDWQCVRVKNLSLLFLKYPAFTEELPLSEIASEGSRYYWIWED